MLRPAAAGRFDATSAADARRRRDAAPMPAVTRAAARDDTARRVAAGGSAHAGAPDVRRTPNLSEEKRIAAQRIADDLVERIGTLESLGLGYLSLDRSTPTLSPGELQRLRLATQIRSNLFGVVYVLDEPTAGLHPTDGEALLAALERSSASGNSIFVVEHDLATMRRADWIVDVGPTPARRAAACSTAARPTGSRRCAARTPRATCSPRPSRARARRASRRAGSSCAASRATTCATSTRASRSAC